MAIIITDAKTNRKKY